jgi:ADP-ribose pyrophosphatase
VRNKPGDSKILWQGRSWRLRVVQLSLPDGANIEKGVIEHPGSVVIVPMMNDRVLMLHQYRLALGETILELPAGTRCWDEDFLACAQRELREETGYRAQRWTSLGQVWPAPGLTDEVMAVYLADDLSYAPLPADADEEIEVRPFPPSELKSMAIDGRLQDAKSIVGILRVTAYLDQLSSSNHPSGRYQR